MPSRSPSRPCRQRSVTAHLSHDPRFNVLFIIFQLDGIANRHQVSAPSTPPSGLKIEGLAASGTPGTPEVPSPLQVPFKAALSSSAPEVVTRPVQATDKERERLLYPGRINLTSEQPIHIAWSPETPSIPIALGARDGFTAETPRGFHPPLVGVLESVDIGLYQKPVMMACLTTSFKFSQLIPISMAMFPIHFDGAPRLPLSADPSSALGSPPASNTAMLSGPILDRTRSTARSPSPWERSLRRTSPTTAKPSPLCPSRPNPRGSIPPKSSPSIHGVTSCPPCSAKSRDLSTSGPASPSPRRT